MGATSAPIANGNLHKIRLSVNKNKSNLSLPPLPNYSSSWLYLAHHWGNLNSFLFLLILLTLIILICFLQCICVITCFYIQIVQIICNLNGFIWLERINIYSITLNGKNCLRYNFFKHKTIFMEQINIVSRGSIVKNLLTFIFNIKKNFL